MSIKIGNKFGICKRFLYFCFINRGIIIYLITVRLYAEGSCLYSRFGGSFLFMKILEIWSMWKCSRLHANGVYKPKKESSYKTL